MIRREEGQIIPMLAVGMLLVLLGVAGLVIDVGNVYVAKRKVQAVADAAALAGAAVLPDTAQAVSVAEQYGATGKNAAAVAGLSAVESTPQPWCLNEVSYCYDNAVGGPPTNDPTQANGLVVHETATVKTTFMRLFGFPTVSVHATATACGLCGAVPLNIVLVVDRTGSMDQSGSMPALKSGIDTLLSSLNPSLDDVSLLVLPPGPATSCRSIGQGAFPFNDSSYPESMDDDYAVVHYSNDYLVRGQLNQSSQLVYDVNNMCASGGTAYKDALAAAKQELDNVPSNRKGYTGVIVFETDGAANTAPDSYFDTSTSKSFDFPNWGTQSVYPPASGHEDDVLRPCGSALDYVNNTIKPAGIVVMTVGYSVTQGDGCYQAPHLVVTTTTTHRNGHTHTTTTYSGVGYQDQAEGTTAPATLKSMASPGDYFPASSASSMQSAFAQIAGKLAGSKLVPDSDAE
ncbi:MAG TPA: pilus assembly protein TadG-related protein [Gaiellaceae bacterium]|nr:pilus assembly protein TadG-related protein [Gaiellaceae bacterium]